MCLLLTCDARRRPAPFGGAVTASKQARIKAAWKLYRLRGDKETEAPAWTLYVETEAPASKLYVETVTKIEAEP